jgi:hypothetical protein
MLNAVLKMPLLPSPMEDLNGSGAGDSPVGELPEIAIEPVAAMLMWPPAPAAP